MIHPYDKLIIEPFKGAIAVLSGAGAAHLMRIANLDIAQAVEAAAKELPSKPEIMYKPQGIMILDYARFYHVVETTALQRSGIAIAKAHNLGECNDFHDMPYIMELSRGLQSSDWNRPSVQARLSPIKKKLMQDSIYQHYFGWAYE